jgi:hypothetical protein
VRHLAVRNLENELVDQALVARMRDTMYHTRVEK